MRLLTLPASDGEPVEPPVQLVDDLTGRLSVEANEIQRTGDR